MAKLTWDAVSAPNFGNPVDGIRTAAELFGRATASAKAGVDQFVAQRNQAAERAIMQRALSVTDPEKLARMQADGSLFGSEGQYASADFLDKLSDRQNDLVALANNQEVLKGNQYKNKRTAEIDTNLDASRGAAFELFARANANDAEGVSAVLANNPELAQLDLQSLGNLFKDATNIQNTANSMANDNTRTGYEGDRLQLDKDRTASQLESNELQRKVSKYNLDRAEVEDGREDITYTAKQDAAKSFFQDLPEMYDDISATKQFAEFAKLSNNPEAMAEYLRLNTNAGYNPVKPVDVAALGAGNISEPTRLALAQIKSLEARVLDGNSSREVPYSQADMEADAADGRSAVEIASTLVGEGKPFPEATALELSKEINTLADANKIKPAQAARILLNSGIPSEWFDTDDIGGAQFDYDKAAKLAERTSTGELLAAAAANDVATSTINSLKSSSEKLVKLEERLSGLQKINSPMGRNGKLNDDEAELMKQIANLREKLSEATGSTQKDTKLFRQN